ncbi:Tubulin-specific chaperone A [Hondaea fermentalgiana]|uniref:Tubulin-specific chaperone A n=1 Tax=Hondaea fermentalgiana TaxID=2315210 RepID=A0A2R5G2L1_9STRA|nr:Tubulin-specific chaperone A [Hondaea fermentalgiana]|eukprot:GBG24559.1 Tubulin-specific chaperone A [Hondaea fermentalgiana]
MDKALEQQLRVKVGVLKRAIKEHNMYAEEVQKTEAQLESMGTEHDRYRQISDALDESKAMLADAKSRVADACSTVQSFLEDNTVPEDAELCVQAKDFVQQATEVR